MADLLTLEELAKKLKVSKTWLYSRTGRGLVPGMVKIGRYCRFDLQEIEEWLQTQKVSSADQ